MLKRGILAVLLGAILAAGTTAYAANGPNKSSISLVTMSAAASSSTSGPHFRDQVTFSISTTATDRPWVNLNCYQNGKWVLGEWQGFFAGYQFGQNFALGPTNMWQGGAADCTASLVMSGNGRDKILAETSFHVEA
jgi:hypothetical protein